MTGGLTNRFNSAARKSIMKTFTAWFNIEGNSEKVRVKARNMDAAKEEVLKKYSPIHLVKIEKGSH